MRTHYLLLFIFILLLKVVSAQTKEDTTFNLCPDVKVCPYYQFPDLNERKFQEIKAYFQENYPTEEMMKLADNSGIITIQFKLNCNGEAGLFTASSCDLNYIKNEVNAEIMNFFLQKAKDLGGWKPPVQSVNGPSLNAHKFYSFRIVMGEITEILPK